MPIVVKVSEELVKAIGATSVSDFPEKLSAHISASKKLESAMAETVSLESLEKRIAALEKNPVVTESRVTELITASVPTAVKTFAEGDEGKKLIGAEASRITTEALASIGTQPAKPAPAAADPTPGAEIKRLESEGKFEDVYALDANLKKDFPDAKSYAAFRRAQAKGQIRIATK